MNAVCKIRLAENHGTSTELNALLCYRCVQLHKVKIYVFTLLRCTNKTTFLRK